jgi:nicotinate-nucleotide adenylyltransferase
MRRGIYGGSFDPVHVGHVELARAALDRARLDRVDFVPAALQPLKSTGPQASDADRLAMLELALADDPHLGVCDLEIRRGGYSYTVETLRQLHDAHPDDELYFLMGADSLHDLPKWREPAEICRLALPVVVARQGEPTPDLSLLAGLVTTERLKAIRAAMIATPVSHVSSTDIRHRLATGQEIRGLVDPRVEEYIKTHGLYGG